MIRGHLGSRVMACLAVAALGPCGCAPHRASRESEPAALAAGDGYYLGTCARCDGLLGSKGESLEVVREGRGLRMCCPECIEAFDRDPTAGRAHVDAVLIADQRPHYPLSTSLVSGRPLGAGALDFIWGNRLFRVASDAERRQLQTRPEHYLQLLNEAVCAAQAGRYGMPDKCPVQGDILASDEPFDIVIANRMIRVCCGRCARVVRARPHQYLGMIDYANRQRAGEVQP